MSVGASRVARWSTSRAPDRRSSAAAFADATDLHYVVGSDALGATGADPIPFSDPGDAAAFADERGGRVLEWGDLS